MMITGNIENNSLLNGCHLTSIHTHGNGTGNIGMHFTKHVVHQRTVAYYTTTWYYQYTSWLTVFWSQAN